MQAVKNESSPVRNARRATSVDVARAARVSQATVSRAFNAPHRVNADKRERVYESASHLGYVPNAIGRSLSLQSSRIIAVMVPAASEYYQNALSALARQVIPQDYQLLLFESFATEHLEVVLTSVLRYHVDGVIVASSLVPVVEVQPLVAQGLPVLMFNQEVGSGEVASVSVDNEGGMRLLADHLIETGHRSVCFVGGMRSARTDQARYRGACERLADAGVACRYLLAGDYSYESGLAAVEGLAATGEWPEAVMAAGDAVAFGVMDGLRERGLSIPDDISVTGFDGLPQAAWDSYRLTTIEQPMDDLARLGVETLVDRMENPEPTTVGHQRLSGRLALRDTVAERR